MLGALITGIRFRGMSGFYSYSYSYLLITYSVGALITRIIRVLG